MNREEILAKAHDAVNTRGTDYGSPAENFERIAAIWSAYADAEFTVEDVGIMMMIVKMSRLMENPAHEDSWVDIAGYAAITAEAITDSLDSPPLPADQQSIEHEM
jgi:hypothetical protein